MIKRNIYRSRRLYESDERNFVIKNGVLEGYKGRDKHIIIPYGVKEIGFKALCYSFDKNDDVISVEIPSSVSKIDRYAFTDCPNLETISIPNSVQNIEGRAFWNCKSLKEIVIPGSVKRILSNTFYGCESLETVYIPKGTKFPKSAFDGKTWCSVKIYDGDTDNIVDEYRVRYGYLEPIE